MAIEHAQRVLNWQENLGVEETPPSWMWVVDDELELWFEQVEQRRKDKYSSGGSDDTEGPMMSNALSRGKRD